MRYANDLNIDAIQRSNALLTHMTNKLSSGRRYMNGELVDPPHLGLWVEDDSLPEISDESETANLFDLDVEDEDEYQCVEWWLDALNDAHVPVLF